MPQILENEATDFMRHLNVPKGRQIRLRSTEISSTALLVTEIHPGDVAEETIPELQRRRQVILWSHGSALKSISCVQEEIDEAKVYLQEERIRYDRLKVRQTRRAEKEAARQTASRAEQRARRTSGTEELRTDQTTASKRSGRPSGSANMLSGHKPRILPRKPSDYSASVTRSPEGTQASGRTGHSRIDLTSQRGIQSAFADQSHSQRSPRPLLPKEGP